MVEGDEIELFDPDMAGFLIHGCTAEQVRKLKEFYKKTTGDLDLSAFDIFTKGL